MTLDLILPTCHIAAVQLVTNRHKRDATQGNYMATPNIDEVECAKYLHDICFVQIV